MKSRQSIRTLTPLVLLAGLLTACESPKHYGQLVGQWHIIEIESRAERLSLDEMLQSKKFTFTGQGKFWQGKLADGVNGKWRIEGRHLQLIQPEIKDLNGRVVTTASQQEWELLISEEWMIWRGTAKHSTQHLKILFQKKRENSENVAG